MRRGGIAVAGALLAGLGVALGAFGAHGLRAVLGASELGWWNTAVQYQMWHAVGLVGIAALPGPRRWPALLLLLGTTIFSGTLYVMALTGMRWLGAVTPIGGLLMIAGWLALALGLWRSSSGVPADDS